MMGTLHEVEYALLIISHSVLLKSKYFSQLLQRIKVRTFYIQLCSSKIVLFLKERGHIM